MTRHLVRILGSITVLFAAQGALALDAGGRLADCPAGFTNIGLAGCGRSADTISTPSQPASCPSGYASKGQYCVRDAETYAKNCFSGGCNPGYTNMGCFCARGASSLSADAMVCPAGYSKDKVAKRCQKNCPAGYRQTGEACFRGVETKGPESFICGPNERRGSGLVANRCFPNSAFNPAAK